jgi:hypothetical protein
MVRVYIPERLSKCMHYNFLAGLSSLASGMPTLKGGRRGPQLPITTLVPVLDFNHTESSAQTLS